MRYMSLEDWQKGKAPEIRTQMVTEKKVRREALAPVLAPKVDPEILKECARRKSTGAQIGRVLNTGHSLSGPSKACARRHKNICKAGQRKFREAEFARLCRRDPNSGAF